MLSVHENTYYISLSTYVVKFCILGRISCLCTIYLYVPSCASCQQPSSLVPVVCFVEWGQPWSDSWRTSQDGRHHHNRWYLKECRTPIYRSWITARFTLAETKQIQVGARGQPSIIEITGMEGGRERYIVSTLCVPYIRIYRNETFCTIYMYRTEGKLWVGNICSCTMHLHCTSIKLTRILHAALTYGCYLACNNLVSLIFAVWDCLWTWRKIFPTRSSHYSAYVHVCMWWAVTTVLSL